MRLTTIVSPLLDAACHVLVDEGRCVVVDPGAGVADDVVALVAREGWVPVAVLLTHGHVDHTWDAAAVSERLGVPVHVHADDAYRLEDPIGSLGPLGEQLLAIAGAGPTTPADVVPFSSPAGDEVVVTLGRGAAVLDVVALHSPGHTQGSTVYLVPGDGAPDGPRTALTGDVLFAGTIGRTDLPGGDAATMARTLARLARLDPATVVHPGHGPASTVGAERARNPYLRAT